MKRVTRSLIHSCIIVLGLWGCGSDDDLNLVATEAVCEGDGSTLELGCPALPNTFPQAQPDWDYFAWNSFIALNWPALDAATNNNQRGFPDLTKSFADAAHDDETVWESFKEKREVFYNGETGDSANPGPWNKAVQYGPPGDEPPVCPDAPADLPDKLLVQVGKSFADSLDETIEVASEALESGDELCQGYSDDPMCGTSDQADCCLVQNKVVGPRVWKGQPTPDQSRPVLYEVKVNYDFYDYVLNNQYYLDTNTRAAAEKGEITLPWRTSSMQGPGGPNPGVTMYSAQACVDDFYEVVSPTTSLTPCPQGSVHLKSAWILLEDEDPADYHTAEALYFKTETDGETTCMTSGTFGLVGFHIIQRVHQSVEGQDKANQLGGTFIFATWEHTDNDSAGFTFANDYRGDGLEPPPLPGFYPRPEEALSVERKFPILPGTVAANTQVQDMLKCGESPASVWCNYELVGVQFQSMDVDPTATDPNDPTGIGQPIYLANTVIETNAGLQEFQGQPPLTSVVSKFSSVPSNGANAFARDNKNMQFMGSAHNMGGCMGCHGVAQTKGFSFSFVLLGGQEGAAIDTESHFEIPPPTLP